MTVREFSRSVLPSTVIVSCAYCQHDIEASFPSTLASHHQHLRKDVRTVGVLLFAVSAIAGETLPPQATDQKIKTEPSPPYSTKVQQP